MSIAMNLIQPRVQYPNSQDLPYGTDSCKASQELNVALAQELERPSLQDGKDHDSKEWTATEALQLKIRIALQRMGVRIGNRESEGLELIEEEIEVESESSLDASFLGEEHNLTAETEETVWSVVGMLHTIHEDQEYWCKAELRLQDQDRDEFMLLMEDESSDTNEDQLFEADYGLDQWSSTEEHSCSDSCSDDDCVSEPGQAGSRRTTKWAWPPALSMSNYRARQYHSLADSGSHD